MLMMSLPTHLGSRLRGKTFYKSKGHKSVYAGIYLHVKSHMLATQDAMDELNRGQLSKPSASAESSWPPSPCQALPCMQARTLGLAFARRAIRMRAFLVCEK